MSADGWTDSDGDEWKSRAADFFRDLADSAKQKHREEGYRLAYNSWWTGKCPVCVGGGRFTYLAADVGYGMGAGIINEPCLCCTGSGAVRYQMEGKYV